MRKAVIRRIYSFHFLEHPIEIRAFNEFVKAKALLAEFNAMP